MTILLTAMASLVTAAMVGPNIADESDNTPIVRVYNVQDLEFVYGDKINVPNLGLGFGISNQMPLIGTNVSAPAVQKPDPRELIRLIESLVEPEIWDGGETASITYWRGNLIVKASQRIHEKIK